MINFLFQNNLDFVFTHSNLSSLPLHSTNVYFIIKIFSVLAVLTIIFLFYNKEIEFKFNSIHFSQRGIDKLVKGIAIVSGLSTIYAGGKEITKDLKKVLNNKPDSNNGKGSSNSNNGSNSNNESSSSTSK